MRLESPAPRETAWFVGLSLGIAWFFGFAWAFRWPLVSNAHRWWLIAAAMCTPGAVGLACAWVFRREPPRAAGFEFTGWGPWIVAFFYPIAAGGIAIALAYAVRAATGRPDFIVYQPGRIGWELFGKVGRGPRALPLVMAETALSLAPWIAIAFVYRARLPERLARALPRIPAVASIARAAVFVLALVAYPGPAPSPGPLGEELGWRGYLVRRWSPRPLVAAALTMPVWALFHLPVAFGETQRGHPLQNVTFLLSIAVAAVPFLALYLWSRSVWPCAAFHFCWNQWNPLLLGNVYSGSPGLFGGAVWIFNGEGVFGVIINGAVAAGILGYFWRKARVGSRSAPPAPPLVAA